jgi:hypothetical protein
MAQPWCLQQNYKWDIASFREGLIILISVLHLLLKVFMEMCANTSGNNFSGCLAFDEMW